MANNEKVQINLDFKVNTQQAQQSMNQLQMNLSKIAMEGSSIKVDSASLNQASEAAKKLSIHLNNAYNASTGKLDLSKFHKSLKQGQDSVKSLSTELLKAGSTGQQAFVQLSQSIAQAERPVITISNRLSKLGDTLKNTIRWQISTSVLQGFTGAIQKAYNYTKDLNQNLNDIRIVTGYSADRMASFAKEANKAAKALSSSTNEYAKASLIYFQQGLSDSEVKERTDATMKMASVTGQAAQEVSDQMTAIWNNFDNGSKSLEYYADVITALGAATASSSEEISEGLNKFAAVAETVGLSYEYAASALATVTATTRQSADIVGTAFKTLFARIQDLELGNTLDDGTTLGQYSEALAKVGINIKDSSGQMKDMNNILDEMGSKWNTLSKDTQVAVAQSVAGVRQYTQLIALMDNWDFFQQNLSTATGAEGTLNKQFAIYEQSWEAASKRMQASAEALYDKLLDDEFFIKLTDGLGSFLDSIGAIIDGLGGMKGVLISVSGILTQMFAGKIQQGIQNLAHNFSIMMGGAAKAHAEITQQMTAANAAAMSNPNLSDESKQQLTSANQLMAMKERMGVLGDSLSEAEKQRYEQEIQIIETHQKENLALQQKLTSQKAIVAEIEKELELLKEEPMEESDLGGDAEALRKIAGQEKMKAIKAGQGPGGNEYDEAQRQLKHFETLDSTRQSFTQTLMDRYDEAQLDPGLKGTPKDITYDFVRAGKESGVQSIKDNFTITGKGYKKGGAFDFMRPDAEQKTPDVSAAKAALEQLQKDMEAITSGAAPELKAAIDSALEAKTGASLKKRIEGVRKALTQVKIEGQNVGKVLKTNLGQEKHITKVTKKVKELNKEQQKTTEIQEDLEKNTKKINKAVKDFNPKHIMGGTEAFLKLTGAASGAVMGVQQLINLVDVWNSQDLSIGEKITSTIMALTMGVPMILQAVGSMKQFGQAVTAARTAQALLNQAINDENVASALSIALSEKEKGAISEETMKKLQQTLVEKGLATETNKQAIANEFLAKTKLKATAAGKAKAAGDALEVAGSKAVEGAIVSQTGAVVANTAAWYTNPITAIIAVALLAVAGAVLAVTSGMKANSEAIQENSKKATEKVEKTREEVKANGDLVNSYLTLYNTYKTTGEGKEELYNISQDLVDIYGIEGGAIAALAGDYKGLTKSIIEARKAELSRQKSSENTVQIAQAAALIDKGTEDNGNTLTEGRFKGEFDNDVWGSQFGTGDDEFGIDTIIKSGNYKYLKISGGDIAFNINKNNVNEVYGLYNELHRFASEMEAAGVSSSSDIYNDVIEEIKSTEEQFLVLQESVQAEREIVKEESMLSATFDNGKTIGDIKNIHDYNKFVNEYRKNYERILKEQGVAEGSSEWKDEINSIDNFLLSHSITGKYAQIEKGLKDLNTTDEIREQLKDLSEEDLQTLWTIKIDPNMTIEEVHKAIEIAQEEAKKFNIYFTPKIQEKGLKLLNEANFEELKKLFDENYELLGMDYMTFLSKFAGDLEGARAFLSGSGKKIENEARLYQSGQDSKLYKTKSDNAREAKKYFDQYDKGKIKKEELLSALEGNQYLKNVKDYLEQERLVIDAQEEIDNLKVGSKDYKDIRKTDKNYFDFNNWVDWTGDSDNEMLTHSKSHQEVGDKTTFKFYDGVGYGNWGIDISMDTNETIRSMANSKLQEAENKTGSDVGRLLNELDDIYKNGSKFTTSFANGMSKQKAAALNVILESNPEALGEEMKTALQEYVKVLTAGGDATNAIKTLDALTNNKFSQEVLNKEYEIENEFVDVSAGLDEMYLTLSNAGLEDLMEGEKGFINRVLNIIDYEAQYRDPAATKAAAEKEKEELAELIRETNIQTAEENLQKAFEFNMEYMIQREALIEQQGLSVETWKALTAQIMANNKALDIASAEKVAENLMLQNQAVQELQDSWQEYTEILNSATSSTLEQVEAIGSLREIISKMTGGAGKQISQTWFQDKENQKIVYNAMTSSDEKSQQDARFSIAQGILQGYGADETTVNRIVSSLENMRDGTALEEGDQWISNILRGESGNYKIDSMTAEDQAGLLNLFGYSIQPLVKHYSKNHVRSFIDNKDGTYTITDSNDITKTFNAQDVVVKYGTTKDENGNEVTDTSVVEGYDVTYINSALTEKDSTAELNLFDLDEAIAKKQDAADMSKQTILLNYQLEQADKLFNNLSEDAEKAFGHKKVSLLRQFSKELKNALFPEQGTGFYDKAIKQAEQNAINMGNIVEFYAKEAGFAGVESVFIDSDFVYNSEAVVEHFQNLIQNLIKNEDILAANGLQEVLNNYIESANKVQDSLEEKEAQILKLRENNLQIILEKYAYNIEILDFEIEELNSKFEDLKDNIWKVEEALQTLFEVDKDKGTILSDTLFGKEQKKLAEYELEYQDLMDKFAKGDIDPEHLYKGLQENKENIQASIDTLKQYDELMKNFYSETVSQAKEEIGKYTDLIEQQNGVLEHYLNISKLIGKTVDYKWLGAILQGQSEGLKTQMESSQKTYQMFADQAGKAKEDYENALSLGSQISQEQLERLKNSWLEAEQASGEAQDKMLADTQAWAESEKAILENSLAGIGQALEQAMTGGFSFDTITKNLEQQNSLQENYLTTTNKIYETNKLIREAEKEIDKTTNSVAKKKLADFQKQTQALGEQNKLSSFELSVQQAKYELLLAEIALEEAQNAKSQVRLRRDSEGNFGYVYTADNNKLSDAEARYAEAENNLYNIRLEGANNAISAQIELNRQYHEELTTLWTDWSNGEIASEKEFDKRKLDLENWYKESSINLSNQRTYAIQDDSRIEQEAWTSKFINVAKSATDFETDISTAMSGATLAFSNWKSVVDQVQQSTGLTLTGLENAVGNRKDKTGVVGKIDELGQALLGTKENPGVIDKMGSLLTTTESVVSYYTTTYLPKLQEVIDKYKEIALASHEAQKAISEPVVEDGLVSSGLYEEEIAKMIEKDEYAALRLIYERYNSYTSQKSWDEFMKLDKDEQKSFLANPEKFETKEEIAIREQAEQNQANHYTPMFGVKTGALLYRDINKSNGGFGSVQETYDRTDQFEFAKTSTAKNKDGILFYEIYSGMYVKASDIYEVKGFDTGGYTGAWGPEGKWAMLHQKEIVLNAQDTENLLAAVDILRQIVSVIDIQSQYNQLANTLIPSVSSYNNNGIEQNVHIEASFPSVTDHNEIEEALNNLINRASQYVNRK